MSFFSYYKRKVRLSILPGTGYQPLPRKNKHVIPPPKNPNSSSTALERTLIMSDTKKEAVNNITKEHKDKIKDFHVKVMGDINGSIKQLTKSSPVQSSTVMAHFAILTNYIKSYRKLVYEELDKLAETFLQEDPGMEVTAGAYDQIKDLITSNNSTDLPDDITRYICDKLISCGYKKINNIKSTINSVVRDRLAANLIVLFEEMDENTVTVETVNIEELKKENAILRSKLAAIEALTK